MAGNGSRPWSEAVSLTSALCGERALGLVKMESAVAAGQGSEQYGSTFRAIPYAFVAAGLRRSAISSRMGRFPSRHLRAILRERLSCRATGNIWPYDTVIKN